MTGTSTQEKPEETSTPAQEVVDHLAALASPVEATAAHTVDQRIREFVEAGRKMSEAKPRSWFVVKLADEARKDVVRDARNVAREIGHRFLVRKSLPGTLKYRVVQAPPAEK